MTHRIWIAAALSFLISFFFLPSLDAAGSAPTEYLNLNGVVSNPQGKRLKEARIRVFVDGSERDFQKEGLTTERGEFQIKLVFPKGTLPGKRVEIEVARPSYRPSERIPLTLLGYLTDEEGNAHYLAHQEITLLQAVTPAFWIATCVLLAVYALIAFEVMHRTLAALAGAVLMLMITYTAGTFHPDYFILSFKDAVNAIDMNVIFLLMAMMIIVGIMKKSGVFPWLAFRSYQISKGNIFFLSSVLMIITAVVSAFLDNVTTMLLMIPVTVEISRALRVNPMILMLPEVFASNIGGTATLIGDPPNIMIGSYAGLTFVDFVINLTPVVAIGLAATIPYFLYRYKAGYRKAKLANSKDLSDELRKEYRITDRRLLTITLVILSGTLFLFIVHGALRMEPSIAALAGASALLILSGVDIVEMLEKEIEWPTLIFFMMLFVVVAGAEETGLIQVIADWVQAVSQGSLLVAVIVVLWVSAIASAFIDNIPFTATMLPIVSYLNQVLPGADSGVLWWSLALGACLGGNGTMIGASANVVTVGMAERAGYAISFREYAKTAFVPMLITVFLSMAWLLMVAL